MPCHTPTKGKPFGTTSISCVQADVVKLIRQYHEDTAVTLCVGDGGNDCNMIQSANVGESSKCWFYRKL